MISIKNKRTAFLLIYTLILLCLTKNSLMIFKQPFSINYGILLLGLLGIMVIDILHYRKLFSHSFINIFIILAIYFFFQFIYMGGYSERVFDFFTVVYPIVVIFWIGLNKDKINIRKTFNIFIIVTTLVIIAQTISTITYVNYKNTGETHLSSVEARKYIEGISSDEVEDIENYRIKTNFTDDENSIHDTLSDIKNYSEKDKYQIPLGGSNYIAAVLVLLMGCILLMKDIRGIFKAIITLLSIITIVMCKSFGGISAAVIVLLACLILNTNIDRKKLKIIFYVFFATIFLIGFAVIVMLCINPSLPIIKKLDILLTGRLSIYRETIFYLFERPLQGYGFIFDAWMNKPHNIVLTILSVGGAIGLAIITYVFIVLYKNSNNIIRISIIATVIQGMIEPNLFNSMFDFIFWTIVAFNIDYKNIKIYSLKELVNKKTTVIAAITLIISILWIGFGNTVKVNYSYINVRDIRFDNIKEDYKDSLIDNVSNSVRNNLIKVDNIYEDVKEKFNVPNFTQYPRNQVLLTYNKEENRFEIREIQGSDSNLEGITNIIYNKMYQKYSRLVIDNPEYNYEKKINKKKLIFLFGAYIAFIGLLSIGVNNYEGNYSCRRKWNKTSSNN